MSFRVEKGEILGFLGPTAQARPPPCGSLRGICRRPDGTVKVDGFDVGDKPLEVRQAHWISAGESAALYRDDVVGYLRFVAKIKGVTVRQRCRRSGA